MIFRLFSAAYSLSMILLLVHGELIGMAYLTGVTLVAYLAYKAVCLVVRA